MGEQYFGKEGCHGVSPSMSTHEVWDVESVHKSTIAIIMSPDAVSGSLASCAPSSDRREDHSLAPAERWGTEAEMSEPVGTSGREGGRQASHIPPVHQLLSHHDPSQAMTISTSQMQQLRLREGKNLTQGHTASSQQNED